jgi:uncharacterized membrane protein
MKKYDDNSRMLYWKADTALFGNSFGILALLCRVKIIFSAF